jgi:hypothetical protein
MRVGWAKLLAGTKWKNESNHDGIQQAVSAGRREHELKGRDSFAKAHARITDHT